MKKPLQSVRNICLLAAGLAAPWTQLPGQQAPLNGPAQTPAQERPVLSYAPLREADVFWEKRLWREIDLREPANAHFAQSEGPFFDLVLEALASGELVGYDSDDFSVPIPPATLRKTIFRSDTVAIPSVEGEAPWEEILDRRLTARDIPRFRVQEVWFFDKQASRFQVRIVGIAPLAVHRDAAGDALFEYPLCWLHYADSRVYLAQRDAVLNPNSLVRLSWEDIFEAHYFFGPITKCTNEMDATLEELFGEEEALRRAEYIQRNLREWEQDLWVDQK